MFRRFVNKAALTVSVIGIGLGYVIFIAYFLGYIG